MQLFFGMWFGVKLITCVLIWNVW